VVLDCDGRKVPYALDRMYAPDEVFTVEVAHVCRPDDRRLEGIYRDVTPPGCPQQYMSQCQQYGFQRILPVIDDCTAKCTFRTVLEGDARYTHLISNGDVVSDTTVGGRRTVVYENRLPMAPYLFLACAGTWDVLSDEVTYPDTGRRIRLEYLVPPGHTDGARVPMEILKRSILFQHEQTGFEYPYETYRTICMEKSLYGGMENTGNTTIITEAALIDDTIPDQRLVYAHGVIPHEFEHSHCGSGVTMETVFDMWLNEAYTVNVERAFLAETFGAAFTRMLEREALQTVGGAFADEEGVLAAPVVREGVNDPDEVVDAITYDKAPEVLNTLERLLGSDTYRAAWREYFTRFNGGNANTDDFLRVFSEVSGRDVAALMKPWLTRADHPVVTASWSWSAGRLTVTLRRDLPYTIPVSYALVKDGRDVGSGVFVLDGPHQTFTASCPRPDFISWNRGGGFYGILESEASPEELALQVRTDSDGGNRVEAMRMLRDRGCADLWLDLYAEIFEDETLDLGVKTALLTISPESRDRRRRAYVRENVREMHALRAAAARRIGVSRVIVALAGAATGGLDAAAIVRRAYENTLLQLLAEADTPESRLALKGYLKRAVHITARLNALTAIVATRDPQRLAVLEAEGKTLRTSLNGMIGYLGVVARDPHEGVLAALAKEEKRKGWSITHPALSRALYCGFAANGDQLWTPAGLAWLEKTLVTYARVSEYNAIRLLAPLANWRWFEPSLRQEVASLLARVSEKLPFSEFPFIGGKIRALRAV
jgi:aminopeptidase N